MALELMRAHTFTHIMTDLALGPDRMDGYGLVETVLGNPHIAAMVLIHSNKRRSEKDAVVQGLPGFAGWTKVVRVKSPWYGRFPFDLLSEILFPIGWRDHHEVLAVLEPQVGTVGDPDLQAVLGRARALRAIMDEARRRRVAEGEQATALEPLLPTSEQGDAAADPNNPAQGEDDGG
jgi:hypothetical protein